MASDARREPAHDPAPRLRPARAPASHRGDLSRARTLAGIVMVGLVAVLLTACSTATEEPAPVGEPAAQNQVTDSVLFGAFTYGGVWSGMEPVRSLESQLGRRLDIVHWFSGWDTPFDPAMVAAVSEGGRAPLVSWQPIGPSVREIADGAYDDYVRSWARGVASTEGPVYVRPFPEMNGNWTPWNGDPELLRTAWRRLAHLFEDEGASNVRWVFSPNVTDEPRTEANRMEAYYPGDDVVDVLALDGYNWGSTREWSTWTPFEDVFRGGYDRITRLGSQPVWFAELASADEGGDKAAWVRDMFASTAFPRLKALVWFDEDKEADWRVSSDAAVLEAFRAGLAGTLPAGDAPASLR